MKDRIKAVIQTLQEILIPATFDNCRKMAGCLGELDTIYGELAESECAIAEPKEENKEDCP